MWDKSIGNWVSGPDLGNSASSRVYGSGGNFVILGDTGSSAWNASAGQWVAGPDVFQSNEGVGIGSAFPEQYAWTSVAPIGSWQNPENWGTAAEMESSWAIQATNFFVSGTQQILIEDDADVYSLLISGVTGQMVIEIESGVTFNVTDTIVVDSMGSLLLDQAGVAADLIDIQPGGSVQGIGTITGDTENRGTVSPGMSPGLLNIVGAFNQHADGLLTIEIAGTAPGSDHDALHVSGQLTANGTLNIELINGFTPTAGNSFDLLDFGSVAGGFFTVNLPALSGNLAWDTSSLLVDGTLSVYLDFPADLDGDGDVDGVDISGFFSNFTGPGGGPPGNPKADLDDDGDVDGVDISGAFSAFTGPLAPINIPEPTSAIYIALAGMTLLSRRRHVARVSNRHTVE